MIDQVFIRTDGRFPWPCYWLVTEDEGETVKMKACDSAGRTTVWTPRYRISKAKLHRDFSENVTNSSEAKR